MNLPSRWWSRKRSAVRSFSHLLIPAGLYPERFLSSARLNAFELRRSEDAFVDLLLTPAAESGVPLIHARYPRAYLDVNREPYELDPRLIDGPIPGFANTRSMRVAAGLGAIPQIVADGQDIYRRRLPVAEAFERIGRCTSPSMPACDGWFNARGPPSASRFSSIGIDAVE